MEFKLSHKELQKEWDAHSDCHRETARSLLYMAEGRPSLIATEEERWTTRKRIRNLLVRLVSDPEGTIQGAQDIDLSSIEITIESVH